jgi:hypothetical protein
MKLDAGGWPLAAHIEDPKRVLFFLCGRRRAAAKSEQPLDLLGLAAGAGRVPISILHTAEQLEGLAALSTAVLV